MNVIQLEAVQWRTRREIADLLGVSERTITRRVSRGEILRRETPNGNLYQLASVSETGRETGRDRMPIPTRPEAVQDSTGRTGQDARRDETGHDAGTVAELVASVATLAQTNAALVEDVRRLQARLDELEAANNKPAMNRLVRLLRDTVSR